MSEMDIGVKRLQKHLSLSLSHLQKNTKLSEEECIAVIDDLEYVKNLSLLKDSTMEEKDVIKSIDELIEEFNISAKGSTQLLREMLTTISEGRVPEKTELTELDQSIDSKLSLVVPPPISMVARPFALVVTLCVSTYTAVMDRVDGVSDPEFPPSFIMLSRTEICWFETRFPLPSRITA